MDNMNFATSFDEAPSAEAFVRDLTARFNASPDVTELVQQHSYYIPQ